MRNSLKIGMLALLASTALMTAPRRRGVGSELERNSRCHRRAVGRRQRAGLHWSAAASTAGTIDGWNGPGWYWCGYAWRRGYGWGGGYGYHGWGWHARSTYWSAVTTTAAWVAWRWWRWRHGRWRRRHGWWRRRHGWWRRRHGWRRRRHGWRRRRHGRRWRRHGWRRWRRHGWWRRPGGMSDVRAKHAITLLGQLDNGLGFYRFSYLGSDQAYVGVMAQEVEAVRPEAIIAPRRRLSPRRLRQARLPDADLRRVGRRGRAYPDSVVH